MCYVIVCRVSLISVKPMELSIIWVIFFFVHEPELSQGMTQDLNEQSVITNLITSSKYKPIHLAMSDMNTYNNMCTQEDNKKLC